MALLCQEEDDEIAVVESGALAILTSNSKTCCEKMFEPRAWLDIFHTLIANGSPKVQRRGMAIILNVTKFGSETAEKLFSADVMDLLDGVS